jgi:hypothetical protein
MVRARPGDMHVENRVESFSLTQYQHYRTSEADCDRAIQVSSHSVVHGRRVQAFRREPRIQGLVEARHPLIRFMTEHEAATL